MEELTYPFSTRELVAIVKHLQRLSRFLPADKAGCFRYVMTDFTQRTVDFWLRHPPLLPLLELLLPPFNGKNMRSYETITEQEVMREMQSWPEGVEFETLDPMMRITLNTILRAVFGAKGDELDELRVVIPAAVEFGSKIALLPSLVRKDLGAWSPGGKFAQYRRRMD